MSRSRWILFFFTALFAFAILAPAFAADDVRGLWKIIDDKTGKPRGYVLLYMFDGKLFGRMVATIDKETGRIKDTLDNRKEKAEKLAGDPYYAGLDFVYRMEDKGKEWRGQIMDPESGDEYDCRVWKEGDRLIVRGQLKGLGFLGRNQTWMRASDSELGGFGVPDPRSFNPVIPKKK